MKGNPAMIYAFFLELLKEALGQTHTEQLNEKTSNGKNYFLLSLIYEVAHLLVKDIEVPT